MDEIQVEIIGLQVVQRALKRLLGLLVAHLVLPQLGRQKQLLARDSTVLDRLCDVGLRVVKGCRVQIAVARLQRQADDIRGLCLRRLVRSERHARNAQTIGQCIAVID